MTTKTKSPATVGLQDLVDVDGRNVGERGFFCYMSKRKSDGYQRKQRWLQARFSEGLRLKLLPSPERGFIEYAPGEHCWRAVEADGYLVIHCLWVVGKSKGRGLGELLLDACLEDARRSKARGVVMLTSERVWLAKRALLDKRGFECADSTGPFSLMVKKLGKHPSPTVAGDWEKKAKALGKGLTILRSDQCPYIPDAVAAAQAAAEKADVKHRVVELESRKDLLRLSPSPYGVFGLALDSRLLAYHYLLEKDLAPLLGG
ncbi:MAG: hypothetical protein QM765_31175 [Myxococcales bacterium]